MSGTDPAVEAAKRVRAQADCGCVDACLTAAAREALTSLRELHRPVTLPNSPLGGPYVACADCWSGSGWSGRGFRTLWPCASARLIYSSAELEGHN